MNMNLPENKPVPPSRLLDKLIKPVIYLGYFVLLPFERTISVIKKPAVTNQNIVKRFNTLTYRVRSSLYLLFKPKLRERLKKSEASIAERPKEKGLTPDASLVVSPTVANSINKPINIAEANLTVPLLLTTGNGRPLVNESNTNSTLMSAKSTQPLSSVKSTIEDEPLSVGPSESNVNNTTLPVKPSELASPDITTSAVPSQAPPSMPPVNFVDKSLPTEQKEPVSNENAWIAQIQKEPAALHNSLSIPMLPASLSSTASKPKISILTRLKSRIRDRILYFIEILKPINKRFFTKLRKIIEHRNKLPLEFKPNFEALILGTAAFIKRRPKKRRRSKHMNAFQVTGIFISGIVFASLFIFTPVVLYSWFRELPKPSLLSQQTPTRSTQILDRRGRLLYEIYVDKEYNPVPLEKIPAHVVKATIAIEDASFYKHHGYDVRGMIRAIKSSIFEDNLQGASTITQQLIKNQLLSPERTISRKIKELVLAVMVETTYNKNQILEMYLNTIPYGGSAYGIQPASHKYFGKDVWDLDLAEASMLAGLPSAPSIYSPLSADPTLSKQRQRLVLNRMVELRYISQKEADAAYEEELTYIHTSEFIRAPHFVAYIRKELEKMYGKRFVDYSGLTITTTLDIDLHDKIQQIVYDKVSSDEFKRLNISNGAVVVLDVRTGGVLSLVGSKNYFDEKYGAFDVTTGSRQPGSSIKPITYALALKNGYTPASIIDDSPVAYQSYGQVYRPVNYDGQFHGNVTLRQALACSYNIPAVKLVRAVGPDNMVQLGIDMGLKTWKVDGSYGLSVTLGGKEVSLLDLTNVYSTFARGGLYKDINPFISIQDAYGYEIYNSLGKYPDAQVLSPEVSYLITHILSDNAARTPAFGPTSALVIPGHTVAVKTGTTDEKRDNYTVGYTPTYAVGVWVGNNDNKPMNPYLASGVSGAAPIWNIVMNQLLAETPNEPFIVPNGILVKVDPACGNRLEVFVKGSNIPQHLCVLDKDKDKDEKKDSKKRKKDDD